jgi:hypothetical protein
MKTLSNLLDIKRSSSDWIRQWSETLRLQNRWLGLVYREFFVVALVLGVLLLVFFEKPIFHNKVLASTDILLLFMPFNEERPDDFQVYNAISSDTVVQMLPWLNFQRDELRQGRVPLWNPYAFAGVPHLANGQSAVFFPLNWLYYVFDLPFGLLIGAFLKLYMAGLLTYYYLREIRLEPLAALFGAVAFMFCGYHILWLGWPHTNVSIFLPGLFLLIEKATEQKQSALSYALLAVVLALQFLGGHPETSLFIITASSFYFLFKLGLNQLTLQHFRGAMKHSLAFMSAGIVGFLMAALQLFPFVEYLLQSAVWLERNYVAANPHYLPWAYLVLLVTPNIYGNPVDGWAIVNYNESVMGYVGLFTVVMAVTAMLYWRDHLGKSYHFFFLGLAAMCIAIIYNVWPVFDLVTKLPLFKASANHRFSVILAFALAVLGALGLNRLVVAGRAHVVRLLVGLMSVGLVMALVDVRLFQGHQDYVETYLWQATLFVGGGVAVIGLRSWRLLPFSLAAFLLLLLLLADVVFMFGRRYESATDPAFFYPANSILEFIDNETTWERSLFPDAPFGSPNFPPNLETYYDISSLRGYDAMKLARYAEFQTASGNFVGNWQGITRWNDRLLDLLNVKYLVTRVPPSFEYRVAQNKKNTPVGEITRDYTVGQVFKAQSNNLAGIVLDMGTLERQNTEDITLRLKTVPAADEILRSVTVNASSIFDNESLLFSFEPVADSLDQSYYFYLESPASKHGNAVSFWGMDKDVYPHGNAFINGQEFQGDVRFAIAYAKLGPQNYEQVYQTSKLQIFKNTDVLPRSFIVTQADVPKNDEEILATLSDPLFDFRSRVLLEDDTALWPISSRRTAREKPGTAEIESYLPSAIRIRTDSQSDGYLVLTDNYYPGWKALVDGQPQSIYRANYTFRAIPISAGQHQVQFLYDPLSFKLGLSVTIISWIGVVVFIIKSRGSQ